MDGTGLAQGQRNLTGGWYRLFTSACCFSHFPVLLHSASRFPSSHPEMTHYVLTLSFVLEYNCFLTPKPLGPFSRPVRGICGWKTDEVLLWPGPGQLVSDCRSPCWNSNVNHLVWAASRKRDLFPSVIFCWVIPMDDMRVSWNKHFQQETGNHIFGSVPTSHLLFLSPSMTYTQAHTCTRTLLYSGGVKTPWKHLQNYCTCIFSSLRKELCVFTINQKNPPPVAFRRLWNVLEGAQACAAPTQNCTTRGLRGSSDLWEFWGTKELFQTAAAQLPSGRCDFRTVPI